MEGGGGGGGGSPSLACDQLLLTDGGACGCGPDQFPLRRLAVLGHLGRCRVRMVKGKRDGVRVELRDEAHKRGEGGGREGGRLNQ